MDKATVRQIEDAAARLSKPKSQIVREAVSDYHSRIGKLSESERKRMLWVLDNLAPRIPERPQSEVDAELAEIRRARREGGRWSMRKMRHTIE